MSKFVILYADGMTNYAMLQAMLPAPTVAATYGATADTLGQARDRFAEMARGTYRDHIPTDDGGPWADVVPAATWDGVTYATDTAYRLSIGPRGGIRGEWI